jgi:integrase
VARVVERTGGTLTGVAGRQRSAKRQRGTLEPLPSGAIRVRVYAGVDPVTKRRHELRETIPAGPQAERLAEHARVRLLNEVYQRRQPRTNATVNELLDRYFKQADWELNTLETYRGYAKKHIRPFIGEEKIGALDDGVVDSLYAELRRCRDHCVSPRGIVDHRTKQKHECDNRCTPHRCKPLRPSTIRQIHFILYGAVGKAVRWKWVSANPISTVEPPAKPKSNPRPPSPEQAARIVSEAFKDPEWGTLVWLTMVTGHRRGELCAIRWRHLDLVSGVLHLERAMANVERQPGRRTPRTTKTGGSRSTPTRCRFSWSIALGSNLGRCSSALRCLTSPSCSPVLPTDRRTFSRTQSASDSASSPLGLGLTRRSTSFVIIRQPNSSPLALMSAPWRVVLVTGAAGQRL